MRKEKIKDRLERIKECEESILNLAPKNTEDSLQICYHCGQIKKLVNIILEI